MTFFYKIDVASVHQQQNNFRFNLILQFFLSSWLIISSSTSKVSNRLHKSRVYLIFIIFYRILSIIILLESNSLRCFCLTVIFNIFYYVSAFTCSSSATRYSHFDLALVEQRIAYIFYVHKIKYQFVDCYSFYLQYYMTDNVYFKSILNTEC